MGNKYIILPKKEYLKYLFSLIIVLNGKFLFEFFLFLNCDTAWITSYHEKGGRGKRRIFPEVPYLVAHDLRFNKS